jgi:hypothetical protein
MMQADQRPSLLQRALGVFVVLALFLALFLWAGRNVMQRPVENVYLDARRLAALRTFERAIVPLKSLRDYPAPTADLIRRHFEFCADPLPEQDRQTVSARSRRSGLTRRPMTWSPPSSGADPARLQHLAIEEADLK